MSPVKKATRQFFFLFLVVVYVSILTSNNHHIVAFCFAAYGLGSIPFGYLLAALAGKDLRKVGSGNIGATNVLRTGNKTLAAITLLLDVLKTFLAVAWLTSYSTDASYSYLIALSAIVGHLYPLWLDFKGGKGVASGLGVMLALNWPVALAGTLIWVGTALWFRISSLAALIAYGSLPVLSLVLGEQDMTWFSLALASLIYIRHKDNLQRLMTGKEPKIGH